MNSLIPLLFIVVLAVIYASMLKESSHRLLLLLGILVLVLVFCFITLWRRQTAESFIGAPVDYALGKCGGFDYSKVGGDITPKIGNYDGLLLGNTKLNNQILPRDKVAYFSPVGDAYGLNPEANESKLYPTVDGKKDSPHQMAMFAYNRVSPDCCPSTYSSDRGCVCMTAEQSDFINRRGNQKSYNGNPDM